MSPRMRLAMAVWLCVLLLAFGLGLMVALFFPSSRSTYDLFFVVYQGTGVSGACTLAVYALNSKRRVP